MQEEVNKLLNYQQKSREVIETLQKKLVETRDQFDLAEKEKSELQQAIKRWQDNGYWSSPDSYFAKIRSPEGKPT